MSILPASQNKRRVLWRNLMILLAVLVLGVAFASKALDFPAHLVMWVLIVPIMIVAHMQFRDLDEMAKQAHYVSWYWGSGIAFLGIVIVQLIFSASGAPYDAISARIMDWFDAGDPKSSFVAGMVAMALFIVAGFSICWTIYYLRRR